MNTTIESVSFKKNGRIWEMRPSDNSVEIVVDGEVKTKIFDDFPFKFCVGDIIRRNGSAVKYKVTDIDRGRKIFQIDGANWFLFERVDEFYLVYRSSNDVKYSVGNWVVSNKNGVKFYVEKINFPEGKCPEYTLVSQSGMSSVVNAHIFDFESHMYGFIDIKGGDWVEYQGMLWCVSNTFSNETIEISAKYNKANKKISKCHDIIHWSPMVSPLIPNKLESVFAALNK